MLIVQYLRRFKHKDWNYSKARYFKKKEIEKLKELFVLHKVRSSIFPPVYMIYGEKI